MSSGRLFDLTSTTNSLLRDGGSVLGGGREARGWQLRQGKDRALGKDIGLSDRLFGALGPAQGREIGTE